MANDPVKGVHSDHWVDFGLGVSNRFEIGYFVLHNCKSF